MCGRKKEVSGACLLISNNKREVNKSEKKMVVSKVGKRKKKDVPVPVKEAPPQIPETPIRFV